jgi:hypothetical protein
LLEVYGDFELLPPVYQPGPAPAMPGIQAALGVETNLTAQEIRQQYMNQLKKSTQGNKEPGAVSDEASGTEGK